MATATSNLVARIRENALQAGTRSSYTDAQIIQIALNPAVREVAAAALTNAKSTTIAVTAGTQDYAISSIIAPFIKSSAVLWGPQRRPVPASWKATNCPSAVRRMSHSTAEAPSASAARAAATVFSGPAARPQRWA